ncbi:MAG: tRNA (adenosine(37)-N6)-threonylcarbamoyltransferase complex ATPase subunit type 1 TsaE [bacterium]|nr:tRNA (adenosine(37)-N6)-threonylcarbamoyltransferase complex ATPase subunit type 1 TsaE [bacterium]
MKFISASEQQTFALVKKFAKTLKGGEVIGLIGNLGAGKTIFTKGLAAGLGIKKRVNSPTFVLMKVYQVKSPSIKHLVHIDAYRLKSAQDIIAIGATEYFNRPDTVTVIEWADKIKKVLPLGTRLVKISCKSKSNSRTININ